jgi:hypothetical protein
MNPILRNILAILAGLIGGSIVNMGLITLGGIVIPAPEGTDTSTMEGLKVAMPLFELKHFLFPFLAHALGVLVGAWLAALIAATQKLTFAMVVGCLFFLGGLYTAIVLPSPVWYIILDLAAAYIPMAWLGYKFAK